jgi:hypothetical protein
MQYKHIPLDLPAYRPLVIGHPSERDQAIAFNEYLRTRETLGIVAKVRAYAKVRKADR